MQRHECNKHNYLCIGDTLEFYFLVKIKVLQTPPPVVLAPAVSAQTKASQEIEKNMRIS
jgi:hypothetical protein